MPNNKFWQKKWICKQQALKEGVAECPGIYLWTRVGPLDGDDAKIGTFWYVGKSKNLATRRGSYLEIIKGFNRADNRHFALSLRAHKDWKFQVLETCKEEELNEHEKQHIKWATETYGLEFTRNVASGGDNDEGDIAPRTIKKYGARAKQYKAKYEALYNYLRETKTIKEIKEIEEKLSPSEK